MSSFLNIDHGTLKRISSNCNYETDYEESPKMKVMLESYNEESPKMKVMLESYNEENDQLKYEVDFIFPSLYFRPKNKSILSKFMKYYYALVIDTQYIFPFQKKCQMGILFSLNCEIPERNAVKLTFPYECYSNSIKEFTQEVRAELWNENKEEYLLSYGTWNRLSSQLNKTFKEDSYHVLYPTFIGKFRTMMRKTWNKEKDIKNWDEINDGNGNFRYISGQLIIKIIKKYLKNGDEEMYYEDVNIYNPIKKKYERKNIILPKNLVHYKRLILSYSKYF